MIANILRLLVAFVGLFKSHERKREVREHEEEAEHIRKNPGQWLNDHFDGGVQQPTDNADLPDDATDTDQARPAKRDD